MAATVHSIYRLTDGIFTGLRVSGPPHLVALNTPPGHAAEPGLHDGALCRKCLQTGRVIAYLPPRPPDTALQTWALNADGTAWVPSETDAAIAQRLRAQIKRLLQESDWTDLVGATARLGPQTAKAWSDYRQALRDMSAQPGWPRNAVFPASPAAPI